MPLPRQAKPDRPFPGSGGRHRLAALCDLDFSLQRKQTRHAAHVRHEVAPGARCYGACYFGRASARLKAAFAHHAQQDCFDLSVVRPGRRSHGVFEPEPAKELKHTFVSK